ncbi:hypothetical protein PHJA_000774000 [Phtheirospermum japonicum]|uniref:Uncharacterized protein n=1 Tax=Phtheirospermum japonicum TaxID=374723 RepID=A0A830BJE3_9LAMI|nr:hypothetical protein PHJA_000774000 [Phtheirospermum japonicum]
MHSFSRSEIHFGRSEALRFGPPNALLPLHSERRVAHARPHFRSPISFPLLKPRPLGGAHPLPAARRPPLHRLGRPRPHRLQRCRRGFIHVDGLAYPR